LKISNAAWRKWQPDCISQYLDFQRIMVRLALAEIYKAQKFSSSFLLSLSGLKGLVD